MKYATKRLTWLGHNCFLFEYNETRFITDPFFVKGVTPYSLNNIQVDYVLVSHGHADHCADALEVAQNSSATLIAVAEVAGYFSKKGIKTEPVNIGGAIYLPVAKDPIEPQAQLLTVQAPHSSTMSDGSSGGNSVGFVLSFSQNGSHLSPAKSPIRPMKRALADASAFSIYFACDTGLFSEMNWIGSLGLDIAVLPIGDRYTMGPSLSLDAVNALQPRYVVPAHFNTWKPIAQNQDLWSEAVRQYTNSSPLVLSPGKSIEEQTDGAWA